MKRLLTLIAVLFMGLSAVFADEYVISKVDCIAADGLYDRELTFKYDDELNVYYIFRSTYSAAYWFTLTPAKLEKFRENLNKVQEWSKLAKEKKASISKELPDSKISVEGAMKRGNNWYSTSWNIDLNFFFISQINDGAEIISLLLRGGEEESIQNEFVDIEFESVVFLNSEIDSLISAISNETIEEAKNKHAHEKITSDMFN